MNKDQKDEIKYEFNTGPRKIRLYYSPDWIEFQYHKNPSDRQIEILAELNLCTVRDILYLLRSRGIEVEYNI